MYSLRVRTNTDSYLMRFPYFDARKILIVVHDVVVTALAVLASFYIRFEEAGIIARKDYLLLALPGFCVIASIVYRYCGLYQSKWRFASLPDLENIVKATATLACGLTVFDYILASTVPGPYGQFLFGKITIVLYFCLQLLFLSGPRVAYRYFRYTRARQHAVAPHSQFCLIVGRAADAELLVRAVESGAVKRIWPIGILSPSAADQRTFVRNVRVLGALGDLERVVGEMRAQGQRLSLLILTPAALTREFKPELLIKQAQRLDLNVRRLAGVEDANDNLATVRLTKLNVEDLLLRPSVQIDVRRLQNLVRDRTVLVTGGGGSIGSELCTRAVMSGAARVVVLENSEPALRAILDKLETILPQSAFEGRIADVRDRERMLRLFAEIRPNVVFHAAALKHVQMVEREWTEGIKTNVFGSVNVADAAVAAEASIVVMISTDKAIAPVSVLGATKRLAEIYCRAVDSDLATRRASGTVVPLRKRAAATRLISVRFGNVLASNGSVVPRFKEQIEAGGPITITHPDMVRYFMTLREASDLVMTSASHALADGDASASVYVLNMGQPIRIMDLAERMIRLFGYEPGEDIEITSVGIRAGERLNEVLFAQDEPTQEIGIDGIVAANPPHASLTEVRELLSRLERALNAEERDAAFEVFRQAVRDFQGTAA